MGRCPRTWRERPARSRSIITARGYAYLLHDVRRYQDATVEVNRAPALSPTNASLVRPSPPNSCRWACSTARATIRLALKRIDTTLILVRFAKYQEQMWVLDPGFCPITRPDAG
jgi:hypothetical protein